MIKAFSKKRNNKGFTLVELLVVMVILGILSTIAVQTLGSQTDKARLAQIKSDMKTMTNAVEIYKAEMGKYPDASANDTRLAQLLSSDTGSDSTTVGPWLKAVPSAPYSATYGVDADGDVVITTSGTASDISALTESDGTVLSASTDYNLTATLDWIVAD